ncbi:T9SS type A sorting domain-containing protein [bacterium]|nr:T9SS type A sorting domain-containing protein [bacterium]
MLKETNKRIVKYFPKSSFILRTSEGEFTYEEQINYTLPASVRERVETIPEQISLTISPNPFNSSCEIIAPKGANIEIYDLNGKHIDTFEEIPAIWQPDESIGSGIYLIRATMGDMTITKQAVLMK